MGNRTLSQAQQNDGLRKIHSIKTPQEEVKQGAAKYEGWKKLAEKESGRVKAFGERNGDHEEERRVKMGKRSPHLKYNAAFGYSWTLCIQIKCCAREALLSPNLMADESQRQS